MRSLDTKRLGASQRDRYLWLDGKSPACHSVWIVACLWSWLLVPLPWRILVVMENSQSPEGVRWLAWSSRSAPSSKISLTWFRLLLAPSSEKLFVGLPCSLWVGDDGCSSSNSNQTTEFFPLNHPDHVQKNASLLLPCCVYLSWASLLMRRTRSSIRSMSVILLRSTCASHLERMSSTASSSRESAAAWTGVSAKASRLTQTSMPGERRYSIRSDPARFTRNITTFSPPISELNFYCELFTKRASPKKSPGRPNLAEKSYSAVMIESRDL